MLQPFWFGMSLGARIGVLLAAVRTCIIVSDHLFLGEDPEGGPSLQGLDLNDTMGGVIHVPVCDKSVHINRGISSWVGTRLVAV